MEKLYKVGFVLFALCAIGWMVGFFTQQSLLSTTCIAFVVIILVATEVLEYLRTNKLRHLIIPAAVTAFCMLLF